MAASNARQENMDEQVTLTKLARKAAEDLASQVGRPGSDLKLVRTFMQTILSNGVIDDRKYLVSSRLRISCADKHVYTFHNTV